VTDYVSQADFDLYIGDEFGATESGLRLASLKAAERMINEHCQRSFAVASTASARLFAPSGTPTLAIHDCTTVTAVSFNGAAVGSTLYQLEPIARSWSGLAEPYNSLRLLLSNWWIINPGEATVSVTATWGWVAVPDDVVEATKIIGKDILTQRRVTGNMATVGDFGGTVRMNSHAMALLRPLRSVHAFGFA
jgi:hypothetical protein